MINDFEAYAFGLAMLNEKESALFMLAKVLLNNKSALSGTAYYGLKKYFND